MKLDIELDYEPADIDIDIMLSHFYCKTINLLSDTKQITIEFDLDNFAPQQLELSFSTTDIKIVKYPVTVSKIIMDDFYSIDKVLYSGQSCINDRYALYLKIKNINLAHELLDTNRLDFTGSLKYTLQWPFYKNVYDYMGN